MNFTAMYSGGCKRINKNITWILMSICMYVDFFFVISRFYELYFSIIMKKYVLYGSNFYPREILFMQFIFWFKTFFGCLLTNYSPQCYYKHQNGTCKKKLSIRLLIIRITDFWNISPAGRLLLHQCQGEWGQFYVHHQKQSNPLILDIL